MNSIQRLIGAFALVAGALASPSVFAITLPYSVTSSGSPVDALAPSADTLTLNAATTTTGLGPFVLQTATFLVGDSGSLMDDFPFTIDETVTINGQSLVIPMSGVLIVTNPTSDNTDSFHFSDGASTYFSSAGVYLTPTYSTSPSGFVGDRFTFNVLANLTRTGAVPEPGSFALFMLGLVALGGIAATTRKRGGPMRSHALPA